MSIRYWNRICTLSPSTCKIILLAAGILMLSTVGESSAGVIEGKVIIKRSPPLSSKIVSRSLIQKYVTKSETTHGNTEATSGELPTVVIYIDDIKTVNNQAADGRVTILDQTHEKFIPYVLPILVGTTVRFLNSDDVYHNVFSYSQAKSFDLGRYATGKYRSVKFDKPGVVKIYCDIHTQMNAFVVVLKNPYFTITDEHGNFVIEDVPPGTYTVKAWYGRWSEQSEILVVKDAGVTKVNFVFP